MLHNIENHLKCGEHYICYACHLSGEPIWVPSIVISCNTQKESATAPDTIKSSGNGERNQHCHNCSTETAFPYTANMDGMLSDKCSQLPEARHLNALHMCSWKTAEAAVQHSHGEWYAANFCWHSDWQLSVLYFIVRQLQCKWICYLSLAEKKSSIISEKKCSKFPFFCCQTSWLAVPHWMANNYNYYNCLEAIYSSPDPRRFLLSLFLAHAAVHSCTNDQLQT